MLRAIVAQARRRAGRSLALVLGVLIATTGFTVLIASTVTSRLQVTHEVEANFRGAYDVLVRPRGTRLDRETSVGLVRPNFLSDEFGGITLAQVDRIRSVVGVEVAAPIAIIGFGFAEAFLDADLGDAMPRHRRSLWRLRTTRVVDDGLTRIAQEPAYVYLTPNELAFGDGALQRRLPVSALLAEE